MHASQHNIYLTVVYILDSVTLTGGNFDFEC